MTDHLQRLEGDLAELKDDMVEVKERVAGHEVRLSNGRKVMGELRSEVEQLKPKAPDWLKLLLAGLSIIGVLMGAQLWLTDRFSERPTNGQLEKRFSPIEASEEKTSKEIRNIRDEQIEQRALINHVKEAQKDQSEKIEEVLDRLPKRRRGR
jgi:cytoskeletal protein RodZ